MVPRRRFAALPLLVAVLCAGSVLAACKGATKKAPTVTVQVTRTPSTSERSTPSHPKTSAKPSGHSSPSGATLHAGPPMSKLPGQCDGLLPTPAIVNAIGQKVHGSAVFVVGLPDRSIGRVGYINCRYGGSKTQPAIEIQVSLYQSDAKAAARIGPNRDDFVGHGAKATKTTVGGVPATLLIGASGAGYAPTIVMALGQRTIAVSIEQGTVKSDKLTHDLEALALLAAQRTTGH
jgi:hypothetical protein